MLPKSTFHYIMLNKDRISELNLKINDEISVEIIPDKSEFSFEMCEELQEVLFSDLEGNVLFQKLTSGKKEALFI